MDKHALAPLFEPASIWVIHEAGHPDLALAEQHLENWNEAGRVRFDPWSPALAALPEAPLRADVVWLLMGIDGACQALPALGRWQCKIALLAGGGSDAQEEALARTACEAGVRVLGPGTLGLQRPAVGLNLSLLGAMPPAGNVAFVSQSGSLAASTLDWALDQGVGFSCVVTLGAQRDIELAEVLDYLALDPATASIVLYLEGVRNPRSFLSALRAATTSKPVVVLKAGREECTVAAAQTHSRALVGNDAVFDCAIRRAGAVRVRFFVQLFSAVKCLASRYRPVGRRLAIVSNGGGPAVLASDWAAESGLELARLADTTRAKLRTIVPLASADNPVDIGEAASAEAYASAVAEVMADPGVDGVLAVHAPKADRDPMIHARSLIGLRESARKPLIACWLGDRSVLEARALLAQARIPTFRTPEPAVDAFGNLASFYRAQQLRWQTPPAIAEGEPPDLDAARLMLAELSAQGRQTLTEMESKALLACFRIPVARTLLARTPQEATLIAQQLGFPVVLKISSKDIAHKSDVGGVILDIRGARQLQAAWSDLVEGVRAQAPQAHIDGVVVEPMVAPRHGRELMVGALRDALFGPVLLFGTGGRAVEIHADRAMELPPLNHFLARRLIERARAARMLGEWRGAPAVAEGAVEEVLVRLSELVCELPEVAEVDLNPLIADEHGAIVVDARIVLAAPGAPATPGYGHMAIMPYPTGLTREALMRDGSAYRLRAIRPEDADALQRFVRELLPQTRYFRFVSNLKELPPQQLARYTQIDYWREMALVAEVGDEDDRHFAGVARYMLNPDGRSCEFAIAIADGWQGRGLGVQLMQALIDVAREQHLERMEGIVLAMNHKMLRLMQHLGFSARPDPQDASLMVVERLL
jgi:acetyltransferase